MDIDSVLLQQQLIHAKIYTNKGGFPGGIIFFPVVKIVAALITYAETILIWLFFAHMKTWLR